jgi:hypothetical protein
MTMADKESDLPITMLRSGGETFTIAGLEGISVLGADAVLRGSAISKLEDTARFELISMVRAGKHVELTVPAMTFRQRDGSPNLNHLRFSGAKLAAIASSFARKPMLIDHNKWSQRFRMGTIVESEGRLDGHGWFGFHQVLHVVKPEGVIGVLDGTIAEFSIGWRGVGAVLCTAHKVDVLGKKSCFWYEDCYPGKRVELDGGAVVAEYEFQNAEGVEVSGVNVPAVSGTRIEDIRAALSAEFGPPPSRSHHVKFPRLAAVLGLAALTEDDDAKQARIVERALAAEEEIADLRRENAELKAKASKPADASATCLSCLDTRIAGAYASGRLKRKRDDSGKELASKSELRLRRIGREEGLAALDAELEEMEPTIPVGKRVVDATVLEPARDDSSVTHHQLTPVGQRHLASVAVQLGHDAKELEQHAATMNGRILAVSKEG